MSAMLTARIRHSKHVPKSCISSLLSHRTYYNPPSQRQKDWWEWSMNPENLTKGWNEDYGDWVPRGDRKLSDRDYMFYGRQMQQIRRDHKEEFYDSLMRRFDEFSRQTDTQMFHKQLRMAQKKERERVRQIRLGAISAAHDTMKARRRMDRERMNVIREYNARDQRRDIIRKMVWEEPAKTWITKENVGDKLNIDFMNKLLRKKHKMHPGLPEVGEYDTLQSVMNTSDVYWQRADGTMREIPAQDRFTSITNRPIPVYNRKDDSMTEYRKETTPQFHAEFEIYKPRPDERQKRPNALMPVWWTKIDWSKKMVERAETQSDLHVPVIFQPGSEKQMDEMEDPRLLCQKAFWDALLLRDVNSVQDVKAKLRSVFFDTDGNKQFVENEDEFNAVLETTLNKEDDLLRDKFRDQIWEVYEDFWQRMKHYNAMHHQSSKLNFDSGLRKLRHDLTKWRYMVVNDEEAYDEFRDQIENPVPPMEVRDKIKHAHFVLEQVENMIRAQRIGIPTLHQFISEIDDDTMQILFMWAEQLAFDGENIAYGQGWALNDYEDEEKAQLRWESMPMLDHPFSAVKASGPAKQLKIGQKKTAKKRARRRVLDSQADFENTIGRNRKRINAAESRMQDTGVGDIRDP